LQKRVVDDEMDVDTDVPVHDRSSSRVLVPTVDFSNAGWPDEYRIGSSPLSEVKGLAGLSRLTTEEKEKDKMPAEMEIEDVCSIRRIPSSTSVQPEMYTVILRTFEFLLTTPIPRAPSARGHVYLLVTFYAYFT
jgi:hypothetical protein